jgi:ribonuclease Y
MDAVLMQISLPGAVLAVFCFVLGVCLMAIVHQMIARTRAKTIAEDLQRQIDGAKKEAENIITSAQIEAAAEAIKKKEEFTAEANRIRGELRENEGRLAKREDIIERQTEMLQQQEKNLKQQEQEVDRRQRNVELKDKQLSVLIAQQKNQLLKITGMGVEEARQLLLKRLEDECEHEMSSLIHRKVEEAEETAEEKSREVISAAIQRYAAEQTCEVTVSTVDIPNDDMKGRIIGREGRNIRAFEKATGVDVIVDDTPGMVVVSGFNPVRREVARLSMERLIQDGSTPPASKSSWPRPGPTSTTRCSSSARTPRWKRTSGACPTS